MVKNLPANTRDMGLIPGSRRSHMPWNNWAHVPQLEKSLSGNEDPAQPKINNFFKKEIIRQRHKDAHFQMFVQVLFIPEKN